MLERIYVDNYKCLVNFEYRPGKLQLLLGSNGSGKSTAFEVLTRLRSFVIDGLSTSELFSASSLTRWQSRKAQSFELTVSSGGGEYLYKLALEYRDQTVREASLPLLLNQASRTDTRPRVAREELRLNGASLFLSEGGETRVFSEGRSEAQLAIVDEERSAVSLLAERRDTSRLGWFRDWLSSLYCIQINPYAMPSESKAEAPYPLRDLSNYASWYRHLSQEQPRVTSGLLEYLKPIILGFEGLALTKEGETTRVLRAEMRDGAARPDRYRFDELSEGQRALAGIYTLLALMKSTPITLCIDEPDNFVALPEIQPWLLELHDAVEEHGSQALIISHHPELINYLAPRDAVLFSRVPEGPVRVAPFAPKSDEPLTAAEIIARGWEERAGSE